MDSIQSIISSSNEKVKITSIYATIAVMIVLFVLYVIYMMRLRSSECSYMSSLYPSLNEYIRPISDADSDCKYNLCDYYIKTAYNACSGGSYKNDFVDICNLKAIIRQGVRCLDFEIYSVTGEPVISSSTVSPFFVKETINYVSFASAFKTICDYAFSSGTAPNSTDPLFIHLRIKSSNQSIYDKMADIFADNTERMLGSEYSFENSGRNLASYPLTTFINKIVIIVDKSNTLFLQNQDFLEYVNLTSNSMFMRKHNYYNIKNNPDVQELTNYNKRGMTIVLPENDSNPSNPSGMLCRAYGCQFVAMRYQYVDTYLMDNNTLFDKASYAFALKPEALRYKAVTIAEPTAQDPALSYQTRTISTDFYSLET